MAVMVTLAQNFVPSLQIAPAFVDEAARFRRHLELVLRPPALARLLRIEGREMLADDLGGFVALDALRAAVPGGDVAVGIEHEDRVVADALDEQAKALLALPQGFLVRAALGQVARDLGEADELALRVANGGDDDVGPEAASRPCARRQPSSSKLPSARATLSSCAGTPRASASGG